MKYSQLNQAAIVNALRGQTLRVPNLYTIFRSWPKPEVQLNRHHEHIKPIVDQGVDRMAVTYPLISRRKKDDIARLASLWYPQASKPHIETLALYTTWLVCWDDAVDANEGDLAGDFARAERWRRQTLQMVREALAIDENGTHEAEDGDPINGVFRDFGSQFCVTALVDQRRLLHDDIRLFIESCAIEQELRLADRIPDFESYMKMRIGTVGGRMLCSLVPYATQERLSAAVASAPEIYQMWTQELRTDCVINAVAAIMEPGMTLEEVVVELEHRMRLAVQEFNDAADKLLKMTESNKELQQTIGRYIDGCRTVVTGTLEFTTTSINVYKA
ncbi:hypothetical protein FSARC_11071 [Fusarium sarcochroum]|uniref:Terpene synthase n=1 Tax=Fusarium sarcochroum TaxID=1208366 RepID=A0A8H4X196_9HYPO|nr:hypothetical protein FSARC_11071 [Fusarium sarcochroum]